MVLGRCRRLGLMAANATHLLLHLGQFRRLTPLGSLQLHHLALEAHALVPDTFVFLLLLLYLHDSHVSEDVVEAWSQPDLIRGNGELVREVFAASDVWLSRKKCTYQLHLLHRLREKKCQLQVHGHCTHIDQRGLD